MGYHKRNRIAYNGVKGERIEVTRPVKKKVPLYLGAASYENQKKKDLLFAIVFLALGLGCILTIIFS
jgi:hypothetical protein